MLTPSSLLMHWALIEVLGTLYETQVLDEIRKNGPMSAEALAVRLPVLAHELKCTLEFVAINAPDVLIRDNDGRFAAGPLCDSINLLNILSFARAYTPVFRNLSSLLCGTKHYGSDVVRNGSWLSKSSEFYGKNIVSNVLHLIQEDGADVVVDIGCGSGHFLDHVVQHMPVVAIGIEYDANKEDLGDASHTFVQGDAADPESWEAHVPAGVKALVMNFVLHEFASTESRLLEVINRYRKIFSGSRLYICEYNGFSYHDLENLTPSMRHAASVYQLIHPLTHQGMPRPCSEWKSLFQEIGTPPEKTADTGSNTTTYVLRL